MEKEKDIIEEIMKKYESDLQNLEKKDNENLVEINKINLHIERLEDEIKEVDPIIEKSLYEEYNRQIEESKKELEKFKVNTAKTQDDKKQEQIERNNLKDSTIFILTKANKEIDDKLRTADLDFQIELNKMHNFKYKYDENHNVLNGDEFKAINDKIEEIKITINDLRDAKELCEKSLEELKQPSKDVEVINSILNGSYDREEDLKIRPATDEDLNVEELKPKISKTTEPTKSDTEKVEPVKPEPETVDSVKPEPVKPEPVKPEPVKAESKEIDAEEIIRKSGMSAEAQKAVMDELNKSKDISREYKEKHDEAANKVDEILIHTTPKKIDNNKMITYTTADSREHSLGSYNYGVESEYDWKKLNITKDLKIAFPDVDFNSEEGKKLFEEFEYGDPNIIRILSNSPEQLKEYKTLLKQNENVTKDDMSFKIQYNIRNLFRSDLSAEAKKDIEENAFRHRHMAQIKKTPLQAIRFAFKGLLEKARKVKALPTADLIKTAPVKDEDVEKLTKKNIERNIETEKFFNEKVKTTSEKAKTTTVVKPEMSNPSYDDIISFGEKYKVDNSDNHIENVATNKMDEASQENKIKPIIEEIGE